MASSSNTGVRSQTMEQYIARAQSAPNSLRESLKEDLEAWNKVKVNLAIIGQAGAGKSTFINELRGLRENQPGAGTVSTSKGTTKPTCYLFPNEPKVSLWDLPGIGTTGHETLEKYCKEVKLSEYDTYLLFTGGRFSHLDFELADKITSSEKSFFLVRSKFDESVRAEKRKPDFDQNRLQRQLKTYCVENLPKEARNVRVFVISSHEPELGEFKELKNAIIDALPVFQQECLTFSLKKFSSIEKTVQLLEGRIKKVALLSALVALNPVPGVSTAFDFAMISKEVEFYRTQLEVPAENSPTFSRLITSEQGVIETLSSLLINGIQYVSAATVIAIVGEQPVEEAVKLIPVVGPLAACGMSFGCTYCFLHHCLKKMKAVAESIARRSLDQTLTE